jgi:hypothetical protein
MKLNAHHVAVLDGRGEGLDVVRNGRSVRGDWGFVGMREVDKLARFDACKKS